MAVVKMRPPVQAQGVDMAEVEEIAAALNDLSDGEFVGTEETFPSEVVEVKKDGKVVKNEDGTAKTSDKGRGRANAQAAKLIRVIESRFDVNLRSRTWQNADGSWSFGIRPKGAEGEDRGEGDDSPEGDDAQE